MIIMALLAAHGPTINPAIVTGIQAVLVAGIVFAGQYVVAKMSKKAQEAPVSVDSQARATEAWQKYAEKMEGRLDRLETRLVEAEVREVDNRKRIHNLERQNEQDRDLMRRLVTRLRAALREVQRLGGSISDADLEVADMASTRLDLAREQEEDHS